MANQLKVAVVTGGHPFDVVPFTQMIRALPVDAYVQSIDDWSHDATAAAQYDAVLWYAMFGDLPADVTGKPKSAREEKWFSTIKSVLGRREQGIVVLHHGIVSFKGWALWNEMTGIEARTENKYKFDQDVPIHIENREHPITRGMKDFQTHDEIYKVGEPVTPAGEVLLSTTHPLSMRAIGWTHNFHDSRVFCLQSGHGPVTYQRPEFRQIIGRALLWSAHRENEIV